MNFLTLRVSSGNMAAVISLKFEIAGLIFYILIIQYGEKWFHLMCSACQGIRTCAKNIFLE